MTAVSEWWSYRPSDFVLFSARSWWRMVEQANVEAWPWHIVAIGLGVAMTLTPALSRERERGRYAWVVLAGAWVSVGCWFHLRHHAAINWAAPWFAGAAFVEAALLLGAAAIGGVRKAKTWPAGVTLMTAAVVLHPLAAVLLGRPWTQAEVFGIAPDPTALATIGLLLSIRPGRWPFAVALWPIPAASLLASAVTLATMR